MNIKQELKEIRDRPKFTPEILYAKNKSIERFNHKTGKSNNTDIHGLLWNERVLLNVGTIDLDTRQCELINPFNGFTWISKIDKIVFCNTDGSPHRYSE